MPTPHRLVRGTLLYTSDKPGRVGVERGREHFTLVTHADGCRTLNSHCEIDDPPPVVRDVVLSFDPARLPTDCHVRLSVGDRMVGTSWFRFLDSRIECEAYTVLEGRVSQRWDVAARPIMFGTHPIQADGLLTQVLDPRGGPRVETYPELFLCSLDHRGATGPLIMKHPTGLKLTLVSREKLQVRAGEFDTWHYQIGDNVERIAEETSNEPGKHPPYDIWVTADDDCIVVLAQVTGYMMTRYELIELQR